MRLPRVETLRLGIFDRFPLSLVVEFPEGTRSDRQVAGTSVFDLQGRGRQGREDGPLPCVPEIASFACKTRPIRFLLVRQQPHFRVVCAMSGLTRLGCPVRVGSGQDLVGETRVQVFEWLLRAFDEGFAEQCCATCLHETKDTARLIVEYSIKPND